MTTKTERKATERQQAIDYLRRRLGIAGQHYCPLYSSDAHIHLLACKTHYGTGHRTYVLLAAVTPSNSESGDPEVHDISRWIGELLGFNADTRRPGIKVPSYLDAHSIAEYLAAALFHEGDDAPVTCHGIEARDYAVV